LSNIADIRTVERQRTALDEFLNDPAAAKAKLDEMILRTELFEAARVAAAAATSDSRRALEEVNAARADLADRQAKLDAEVQEMAKAVKFVAETKAEISQRERALIRADDAMIARAAENEASMAAREAAVTKRESEIEAKEADALAVREEFTRRMQAVLMAAST